jgi:hypothetical protein
MCAWRNGARVRSRQCVAAPLRSWRSVRCHGSTEGCNNLQRMMQTCIAYSCGSYTYTWCTVARLRCSTSPNALRCERARGVRGRPGCLPARVQRLVDRGRVDGPFHQLRHARRHVPTPARCGRGRRRCGSGWAPAAVRGEPQSRRRRGPARMGCDSTAARVPAQMWARGGPAPYGSARFARCDRSPRLASFSRRLCACSAVISSTGCARPCESACARVCMCVREQTQVCVCVRVSVSVRAVLLSRHSQAHGCSNRPRAEACARPCNTPTGERAPSSRKHAKRNSNNNVLRCFDMNTCAGGQAGRPARRRPRSLSARATRAGTPRRAARSCACGPRTSVPAFACVRARVCRRCARAQSCDGGSVRRTCPCRGRAPRGSCA